MKPRVKRIDLIWLVAGLLFVWGCTGLTFGENQPGDDTHLDPPESEHAIGALAVEPDESHVWLVHQSVDELQHSKAFFTAVDPVTGHAKDVLDVSNTHDRRVVFPSADRVLLMGQNEQNTHENLILFDADTLTPITSAQKATYYWGTRTSPSGNYLAVADNRHDLAPIHVIDTHTLNHVVVDHGGEAIEAMWTPGLDQLVAVSGVDVWGENPSIRILRWNVDAASLDTWPAPDVDIVLAGFDWDYLFSFTWIGISPDGRWAVFPLKDELGAHTLVVLDQTDGSLRTVEGQGPVGFTPDSSSIVSYGYYEDETTGDSLAELQMIDITTLAVEHVPLDMAGGVSFFVTWDGNYVVATSVFSDTEQLVIYDPVAQTQTKVDGPYVSLNEFVTRPGHHQLWLADNLSLWRLELDTAVLQSMNLPFSVKRINILPTQDRLVLGPPDGGLLRFYDLVTEQVDMEVELTPPIVAGGSS